MSATAPAFVCVSVTGAEAIASDGSFAVEPGQLALAPGSSGWTNPQGEETRWMELFLRSGSAWSCLSARRYHQVSYNQVKQTLKIPDPEGYPVNALTNRLSASLREISPV